MKLYYAPGPRAVRPRWMLEELREPYGLVRVRVEAPMFGIRIPTLVDGDVALTGSAAICAYLADKFLDRGLAPRPGQPERDEYLQWLHYGAAVLDPLLFDASCATNRQDAAALARARSAFRQRAQIVEEALAGQRYLVGGEFTAADVTIGSILRTATAIGLYTERSNLGEYTARLTQRDAYRSAGAD
jgi:glutathione S-transferase